MKKRFNVIAAAVLALGMVVGMCGCEGQLPQPKTTQRQDAPNLTAKQEKTIRTNILKTLDQCNNDRNIDASVRFWRGRNLRFALANFMWRRSRAILTARPRFQLILRRP